MWPESQKNCLEIHGLKKTKESLRAKCRSVAQDVQIWLTCLRRVKSIVTTGGISEDELEKKTQTLYQIRIRTNSETVPRFKKH